MEDIKKEKIKKIDEMLTMKPMNFSTFFYMYLKAKELENEYVTSDFENEIVKFECFKDDKE